MSRVPLRDAKELPEEYQYLLADDAMGELNIFRAMGNNPPVLQSYMRFGAVLWDECGLPPAQRELAILVVARILDSRYEWHQHVGLARTAGLADEKIDAVGRKKWSYFDGHEEAIVSAIRAIARGERVDHAINTLGDVVDDRVVVGVTLLAGYYVATARALAAWDIPVEGEFVGWAPSED